MNTVVKPWKSPDGFHHGWSFQCPGCNDIHSINSGWGWNGDLVKPTFTPSVLVTSGHLSPGSNAQATGMCWCNYEQRTGQKSKFNCGVCHSFVTNGRIQFLGDCTHALANQTVDLPEWKDD
jgi:Family of unknown function (DUF6527)